MARNWGDIPLVPGKMPQNDPLATKTRSAAYPSKCLI